MVIPIPDKTSLWLYPKNNPKPILIIVKYTKNHKSIMTESYKHWWIIIKEILSISDLSLWLLK
jgi:hypothetical protein